MSATGCPKRMAFGPCGGVRADLACEVDARPCPFVTPPSASAPASAEAAPAPAGRGLRRPIGLPDPAIVVDVRAPSMWAGDDRALWRRIATTVAGCSALIGEHADNPQRHEDTGRLPPDEAVAILHDEGVPAIVTVTGRDRDGVDARRLVEHYGRAGASAIHCVTGDHPAALGIDRPTWFGSESMRLVALPAEVGLPATVAESPSAPGDRPARVLAKQRAGASACILNHGGGARELVDFVDRCRAIGVDLPMVAPVPMVADKQAALGLAAFPGIHLPAGHLQRILDAAAPAEEALALARDLAGQLIGSGRFAGINLSGGASGTTPDERLEMTGRFIDAVRDASAATEADRAARVPLPTEEEP